MLGDKPDPAFLISEVFNATEGFYATQIDEGDMVLLPDGGIVHEFVPAADARAGRLDRAITLDGVALGVEYAMVISTGCGLWRYLNGDTVRFTGRDPWRLRVAGRVSQALNIASEELSVENADRAMAAVCAMLGAWLVDYTATGLKLTGAENAVHLWLVEVESRPDPQRFSRLLDDALGRGVSRLRQGTGNGPRGRAPVSGWRHRWSCCCPPARSCAGCAPVSAPHSARQSKLPRLEPDHAIAAALLAQLTPAERAAACAHLSPTQLTWIHLVPLSVLP